MLPDFIIIGVHKAGTTSLHQYFDQHPQVFMTSVKEPNYFSFDESNPRHVKDAGNFFRVRTREKYEALFDDAGSGQLRGEASPSYFRSQVAGPRIREAIPDCRLILSLRNPVDRAYSAYQMAFRNGATVKSVEEVDPSGDPWVKESRYADSLERYLGWFGFEQLRIVLFETMKSRPVALMRELFAFVGVDAEYSIDASYRFNPGGLPRNPVAHRVSVALRKVPGVLEHTPRFVRRFAANLRDRNLKEAPPLDIAVRARWLEHLREDILRTEELARIDLQDWLRAG